MFHQEILWDHFVSEPEGIFLAGIINMLKVILLSSGCFLKMSLLSCDGGHKDNFSKPENVLTDNWSSEGRIILLFVTVVVFVFYFTPALL